MSSHTIGPQTPMSVAPDNIPARVLASRDPTPGALAAAAWFRRLARALKACRLYKSENSMVAHNRDQVLESLQGLLRESHGWTLRFTPTEIFVNAESVIRPKTRTETEEDSPSTSETELPFIFYRDGIRAMRIPLDVPLEELEALFEALKVVGGGTVTHDDLVTLLWQANLRHIEIDSVPLEQTIYVSSHAGGGPEDTNGGAGAPAWTATGGQIHADLGQAASGQGLHRDTFDDWELADNYAEVPAAYAHLLPAMEYSLEHFHAAWQDEQRRDWSSEAPLVLRQILALDPSEESRQAVLHSAVTWVGEALQRTSLGEAQRAVELLRELDPDHSRSEHELATTLAQLDHDRLVEYLDEAEPDDHARFAAVAVALGKPAIDLAYSLMSKTTHNRVRAAACTALCYLCADEPQLLAPYFADAQGDVMVHLVFTLGQIGGPDVVDLLRLAAQHPEPKVRKQVVVALGGVPVAIRVPPLVASLETRDPQLL